jgi:undecaprenyl-diphosphatase
MITPLLELDKAFFLYLNGFHAPWLDPIMLFLTHTWVWLPLYIFLAYLIIKDFQKESWLVLAGITLTILLADQITASFMKPYFARLRPSQDPSLQSLIHLVQNYKGGQYGFASSHAANTFATATFCWLLFGKTKRWIMILFLWAALMTYTRIYLGVHYPGDILVGGIVGILSGITGYKFFDWLRKVYEKRRADLPDTE